MSKQQTWLQLVCHTTSENSDSIENTMEEAGSLSITLQDAKDDPVLEPLPGEVPLWKELIITALFNSDANLNDLSETLKSNKDKWKIQNFHIETLEDREWERVWMKDFHPMRFGDNLWIYPSNYEIPNDDSIKIHLDPGLAFGTGTHPTTALCLEWLDQNPPKKLNVIDYGCGSGILAVAAAKLGATHISAIDIDPQGLTATKENMLRNSITDDVISCYLPTDFKAEPVDLLIANILCGPLIELYPLLSALIRPRGKLVLSGLLEEQKEQVIEVYSSTFKDFKVKVMDNWTRISATKAS